MDDARHYPQKDAERREGGRCRRTGVRSSARSPAETLNARPGSRRAVTNAADTVERTRVHARLLDAGIAPTIQRLEIGRIVFGGPIHIAADDLYRKLRERSLPISRGTIYNTLKLFVSKGLLREIIVSAERVFYDSTAAPHHHFYDVDTGELIDIPRDEVAVTRFPTPPSNMETEEIEVLIRIRKTTGAKPSAQAAASSG
jgi:Fur family iron response transcriptional regulator